MTKRLNCQMKSLEIKTNHFSLLQEPLWFVFWLKTISVLAQIYCVSNKNFYASIYIILQTLIISFLSMMSSLSISRQEINSVADASEL